jgi:hypothetical protein
MHSISKLIFTAHPRPMPLLIAHADSPFWAHPGGFALEGVELEELRGSEVLLWVQNSTSHLRHRFSIL